MTNSDSEQREANSRLVAAMKRLGVFSRIENDGRIPASESGSSKGLQAWRSPSVTSL